MWNGQQVVIHFLATNHHRLEVAEVEVLGKDEVVLPLTPHASAHRRVSVPQRAHLPRHLAKVVRVCGKIERR